MPGTTESEEEKGGQNAQLTPSANHLQSFLQYLQGPERAEEEAGTASWVVLPVHCARPTLSATLAVLRSSDLFFVVHVEQAALAITVHSLVRWMDGSIDA